MREVDPASKPTLHELNERERDWLSGVLSAMEANHVDVDDLVSIGRYFDSELTRWRSLPDGQRPDPNPVVTSLGAAFGEYVRRRAGLRWVIAEDGSGSDAALHREEGDVLVYPISATAKRWVAGRPGALVEFGEVLVHRLSSPDLSG